MKRLSIKKSENIDNEVIFKEVKTLLHNQNMNKSKLNSLIRICLKYFFLDLIMSVRPDAKKYHIKPMNYSSVGLK